jgi:hypothetical protein
MTTLPTNDDFANRELSIEELEAIAAGWPHFLHSALHAVEHGLDFLGKPITKALGIYSPTVTRAVGGGVAAELLGAAAVLALF